ncbi:HNH endonuclease signature motif containing protein [Kineosporia sp. R_H_3]|uniref:HNH endonuclease signature motif containing protein n=1 Tax=Kineosporia sp. R_H_3 TaxID=1961848 RepID=UPI000B4BFDE7|nr:HNH endonuclease signature motif containing protein [Kineosporia sp. R_H_3]
MSSDDQTQGEVPGSEPDAVIPAAHVVSDISMPVHDLQAGVAAMKAATAMVLEASRCAWSLSDSEARDVVEAFTRAMASAEAARLAVIKVLDERPEAVPGASEGKVAAAFLTGRLNVDQGRANADARAAHALDADSGSLPQVGAALAAGEITREHADACVRAVARLPKRLRVVLLEDEATGELKSGMEIADAFLAEQCRRFPVRAIHRLVDELVRVLDPDREEDFDEDAHLRRGLSLVKDSTGMGSLRMTLTPADTAVLSAMLSAAGKPRPAREVLTVDSEGVEQVTLVKDDRTVAMRRYDAVMGLLRAGLTGDSGGEAPSPLVNLLVTATVEQVAAAGAAAERVRRRATAGAGGDLDEPTAADAAARSDFGCAADVDAGARAGTCAGAAGAGAAGAGAAGAGSIPEALSNNGSGSSVACRVGRAAGLATLHRHGPIGSHLLAYLACAATLTRVLLDPNGAPLDVGRTHRLATPAQRKALAARDGGCVIPACPVPHEGTDAHHLQAWEHGGPTDLHNLVSLCPAHHQQVHAGLWVVEVLDGIVWVRPPSWIDPQRRRTRNLHHQTHAAAQRIGQQLRLALDEDADARGVGPNRTGLTPIDLTPPIWNQAPPDDTWERAG